MSSSPSSRSVTAAGNDARCPKCDARVRPGQTWCSLCHTDLSAASEEASTPAVVDELGDGPADTPQPADTADPSDAEPSNADPSTAEPATAATSNAETSNADPADEELTPERSAALAEAALAADRMLVELAAAEADRARESGVHALQGRLGTGGRSTAMLIAGVGGALLLAVIVLGLTLLGLLL
jgi:hypothetical protein